MPILLTDTIAPNNTTFKAVLGKDVGGAITGSVVSSSGEVLGTNITSLTVSSSGTGSFGHVSSSGGLFANLTDNDEGSLKTVIFDDSSKQLFITTSTAAGVPSLTAVSQVDPFEFASDKVMTASNGAGSGILVNRIFNGASNGSGRAEFGYSFGGGTFGITDAQTEEDDAAYHGLWISGGADVFNTAPSIVARSNHGLDIIHASSDDSIYKKIASFNSSSAISEPSPYNLILHSGSIGNASTFGNLRVDKTRAELIDVRQLLIRPVSATTIGSTVMYDSPIKTRISQTGGTGPDQFIELSGSGVILQPTSSLPTAIEGGMVYSGSQFYIAVP